MTVPPSAPSLSAQWYCMQHADALSVKPSAPATQHCRARVQMSLRGTSDVLPMPIQTSPDHTLWRSEALVSELLSTDPAYRTPRCGCSVRVEAMTSDNTGLRPLTPYEPPVHGNTDRLSAVAPCAHAVDTEESSVADEVAITEFTDRLTVEVEGLDLDEHVAIPVSEPMEVGFYHPKTRSERVFRVYGFTASGHPLVLGRVSHMHREVRGSLVG